MYPLVTGEGVSVGFESMKYVASESEGEVQVCLTISEAVNEDLLFSLHTEQKSAHGMVEFNSMQTHSSSIILLQKLTLTYAVFRKWCLYFCR